MTVVETGRFLKDTKLLMSDTERAALVAFVGANPEAGESYLRPVASGRSAGPWQVEASGAVHE
jgi:hypothetical protein